MSKSIEYSFTMHFADLQLPSTVPELRTSLPDMEMEDLHQQQHRQPLIDTETRAQEGGAQPRRCTPQRQKVNIPRLSSFCLQMGVL